MKENLVVPNGTPIGEKIRLLRFKKGLSQESLGFSIGVCQKTMSNIEKGRAEPTISQLQLLACELEVNITELLPPPPFNGRNLILFKTTMISRKAA